MPEKSIWDKPVGEPMTSRLDVLQDLERELAARDTAFAQKEADAGDQKTQPAYLATEPAPGQGEPQLPVVVVSAREEPGVMRRALDHGAMGFIPKSADSGTLGRALAQVLQGDRWAPSAALAAPAADADEHDAAQRVAGLTPQQFRVLQMLGAGLLNKQIAFELGVSEATIKAHMTAILRKLGASNRTQALLIAGKLALEPGAITPQPDEGD
jgi:DNA-binding NarL/FixJ family response regulator